MYIKRILPYITILILFAWTMQAGAWLLWYKVQQRYIQYQMINAIKSNKAHEETFILSIEEYKFTRINSHENLINGQMYDIKTITMQGDSVIMVAVNDTKEKALIEQIKQLSNHDNQNRQLPSKVARWFMSLLFENVPQHVFCNTQTSTSIIYVVYSEKIVSYPPSLLSPPPEQV